MGTEETRTTAHPAGTSTAPLKVLVYLPEGMADWEVGHLMAELRQQNLTERPADVVAVTESGGPVTSMGGLTVQPAAGLADRAGEEWDVLVLCGGTSWEDPAANRSVVELAAARKAGGRLVAAICGAVDALAGAGLLDDVRHTGNDLEWLEKRPGYAGAAEFVREPHAVRGKTPAGGAFVTAGSWASTDFAASVMAELGALGGDRAEAWLRFWRDRDAAAIAELFAAAGGSA